MPRPVRPARSPLHLLSGARLSEPAEPSRVDHPDRVRGHTPDGLRRRRVGTGGDEVTSRLTLTRASLLTGTVKDGEGRPVSGAKILLSGRPSRARSGARRCRHSFASPAGGVAAATGRVVDPDQVEVAVEVGEEDFVRVDFHQRDRRLRASTRYVACAAASATHVATRARRMGTPGRPACPGPHAPGGTHAAHAEKNEQEGARAARRPRPTCRFRPPQSVALLHDPPLR